MTLVADVVDGFTDPPPPGWDEFASSHRLLPGWYSEPIRAIGWCLPAASSMVAVRRSGGSDPVALFQARHFGPTNPARFAAPGRMPAVSLTECRTAPVPMEAGFTFAEGTDDRDRAEAVRVFERAVRRRAGPGGAGILYRSVLERHLPLIPTSGRALLRLRPLMVLPNRWPDLDSYLAWLPRKARSHLQRVRDTFRADSCLTVGLSDTIDPVEASWLAEVVRLRHVSGPIPRPGLPARALAQIALLPGARFLTYRDRQGRLLGYTVVYDNGTELRLVLWGGRSGTDGRPADLYFDQYLRGIELMISLGRRELGLGNGQERLKARLGARPVACWGLIGSAWSAGASPRRRRREPASPVPAGPGAPDGSGTSAGGGLPGGGLRRRLVIQVREDPDRKGGPARRPGRWRHQLLTLLGRSPDSTGATTSCRQCGESGSVNLVRLAARSARYWCQRCGAVVSLRHLAALRPVHDLRAQDPPDRPGSPGGPAARRPAGRRSAAGTPRASALRTPAATATAAGAATAIAAGAATAIADGADGAAPVLREVMPAAMVGWVHARYRNPSRAVRLDKAGMFQVYQDWDRHLRKIGPAAAARLAGPGEPPPGPDLPAFATVVRALHDRCYHVDEVVRFLSASPDGPPPPAGAALRERVEHARRWLARYGRAYCWIHTRLPDSGPAVPDRAAVEAARAALRAGRQPDPVAAHAARAALFGTDGGPALSALLETYPAGRMAAALAAYLATGERTLRDETLDRLTSASGPA